MKVLVLMGGVSLERDVSLASGAAIARALEELGHDVTTLDSAGESEIATGQTKLIPEDIKTTPPDLQEISRLDRRQSLKLATLETLPDFDAVFLGLHGGAGEDGTIQSLLELADVKYTGSGRLSSALCMNKAISKKLFEREGIPTPDWMLLKKSEFTEDDFDELRQEFPAPVIVKPNDQGSTVGLTLVEEDDQFMKAIDDAFAVTDEVLIEDYIDGRELTVAVLGDQPLPVVEIMPKNKLYDYECKYTEGMCSYKCPADLPDELAVELQELGLRAFRALNCSGYARVDFRMNAENDLFCLEVNTLPGMTKTSLVPKAAKAAGMSFNDLIQKIIDLAVGS